ncbi:MAG TPA: AcvB/VirJ family lysyl-phosphatidylglycerol hydrolase [Steroidobacteraceae bacterium]
MRHTKSIISLTLLAVLLAALSFGARRSWPRWVETGELGRVQVFPAWLRERGFVYVLSGAEGWTRADELTALLYAARGNYVTAIDAPRLVQRLNRITQGCLFMPGLLDDYSREQQIATGTRRFYEPALLGRGPGATLVYLAQLGAPPSTFGAAVMLDPEPRLALHVPPCDHAVELSDAAGEQFKAEALSSYVPARLLLDDQAGAASRAFVAEVLARSRAVAPALSPTAPLHSAYAAALSDIEQEQRRSGVGDLPLVEVMAAERSQRVFAVLYSGDGGWRDLDRSLADILASKGMNVVGVDVLRYYWRTKPPAKAAADLARIIEHYQRRWGLKQTVLIGFSFGADVLPFLVNRLPPALRADVRLVTLLAPERYTAFEVDPSGWFHRQADATTPIAPELERMSTDRLQCVYGENEANESLCTTPAARGAQIIRKPGGHHFDHDYGALADAIIAACAH